MKMNDANVVVLRFGSQDVIATSIAYTWYSTPLAGDGGDYNYENIYAFVALGGQRSLTNAPSPMSLRVSYSGTVPYWDSLYFIFGACQKNNTGYSLTVTGSEDAPSGAGYTYLTSQKDIIDWLIANAKEVS